MVEEVEKLFTEMKGRNLVPNVITYTTMLKGFVAKKQIDNALAIFEEMKIYGIKPNAVAFTTLLPGLYDAEKFMEAQNALNEMLDRYITPKDNSIFHKLLTCQCKSGELGAAVDVLKAIIRLSIPTKAGHYGILIENFHEANAYDRAVKLLDKLVEKDIILRPQSSLEMKPDAYKPMIEYLCNDGQTSKVKTFFWQLMKKGVQDSVAFSKLICGHSKEGNPESAFEIIKTMDRSGVPREADSYRLLIESCLRKREPFYAKTALDIMLESGHLPDLSRYRSVMDSLFGDGRVQTTSRVMKSMVDKGVMENVDLVG